MNTSESIFPMSNQHKAKPEEWSYIKHWAICRPVESGVYELLHRIEALEAAQQAKPNHPEIPDSSLVDRVEDAMDGATEWQAREAIRAVAAWLREKKPHMAGNCSYFASSLEQESER